MAVGLRDDHVLCYRVVDIAQILLTKYKSRAAIDRAREWESPHDTAPRLIAERQMAKAAAAKWMASSTGTPWLLHLLADVFAHSVLRFLDFEQLMGARNPPVEPELGPRKSATAVIGH